MTTIVLESDKDVKPKEGRGGNKFPIPRYRKPNDMKPAIVPEYFVQEDKFSADLFQKLYSLVNFELVNFDLSLKAESNISDAFITVFSSFENENECDGEVQTKTDKNLDDLPETIAMRSHIIRKYLLACQEKFFELSTNPVLNKIALLHNDLFLASDLLNNAKYYQELKDFCDMLMADTLDLYNSAVSELIKQKYWASGRTADDVIKEVLIKELEVANSMNNTTCLQFTRCAIKRAIDGAPSHGVQKIKTWANENFIRVD